jgi:hypothetical protein
MKEEYQTGEPKANRKHKDSVFTMLFSDKNALLEMYNAVSGENYPEDTEIEIITLSDAMFLNQLNDIAFVIEKRLVVLMEHQSSRNENIPLRMLLYMAREYERITKSKDLHREKQIKIPTPEFIVLYNGKKDCPDYEELRLSDSYEVKNETVNLELVAKIYNINKGHNAEIAKRSVNLSGYSEFVAEVKENSKTMSLLEAIKAAMKTCIGKNILLSFFDKHGCEVENMLLSEWNMKDALEVAREEGKEEGREEGIGIGVGIGTEKGVGIGLGKAFALWESGISLDEAKRKSGFV